MHDLAHVLDGYDLYFILIFVVYSIGLYNLR